jgi:hypothetical protein
MIDIIYFQETYKRKQIMEIKEIDRKTNPIDTITKNKPCIAFTRLIDTNQIDL